MFWNTWCPPNVSKYPVLPSRVLVLYSNEMNVFQHWQERFESLGLGELWHELARPGSPTAFLAAQGLRLIQPALSAFTDEAGVTAIASLAARLEGPDETETQP